MAESQSIDLNDVRAFTNKTVDGSKPFRFFRYSQNFESDSDFGQKGLISGIQMQTIAQCLIDFFKYDQKTLVFDSGIKNSNSIQNDKYKNKSKLSKTIGEIQSGNGQGDLKAISKLLKLQIIKRYNPEYAKDKLDQTLIQDSIKLKDVAGEQIGVIGPVTYNFLIRQSIFKWFKDTYLSNTNSYLYSSLRLLKSNWTEADIDSEKKYLLFVSDNGIPLNKPYPTIGVLFDKQKNEDDEQFKNRAKTIIDAILSRNVDPQYLKVSKYKYPKRPQDPERICVYADFAEVLYSPISQQGTSVYDILKAGVSFLHGDAPVRFNLKEGSPSTVDTIRETINEPVKWGLISENIDSSALYFIDKNGLKKDAEFFKIVDSGDNSYQEQYDIKTSVLFPSHKKYIDLICDKVEAERQARTNIFLRNYQTTPFNEQVSFYYDKNYNLLAGTIRKNSTATKQAAEVEPSICITKINNSNLAVPQAEEPISILDSLPSSGDLTKYIKLNSETLVFITEFFAREIAESSEYSQNQILYDKIKTDVTNALSSTTDQKIKNQVASIPKKEDVFYSGDYAKIKTQNIFYFDKNSLLSTVDQKAALQFAKLKTFNFWTLNNEKIRIAAVDLDSFLQSHKPDLEHKPAEKKKELPEPSPESPVAVEKPPSATTPEEDKTKPIPPPAGNFAPKVGALPISLPNNNFERLKTERFAIPNDIDLSSAIRVDDLLAGDCFTALIGLLTSIPVAKQDAFVLEIISRIYEIISNLDVCYLANLALNEKATLLKLLTPTDPESEGAKAVQTSIDSTLEDLKQCLPDQPPPKKYTEPIENPEDLFRISCNLVLQNLPNIPYLFTLDFLKSIASLILEAIIQIVLELVVQFINSLVKELNLLCKNTDNTALAISALPAPSKRPFLPSPSDALDELTEKCSIIELLSTNQNIGKVQIYNVTRDFFGYNDISNSDFDTFFAGLSSVLTTQEIINIFTNNIDNYLNQVITNYGNKPEYQRFNKVLFNISTTKSFFNFLARYVNLEPCYLQLAKDRNNPNYCSPRNTVIVIPQQESPLTNEEFLQTANELVSQIVDICQYLSSSNDLSDKFNNVILLNEEAKAAIAAGVESLISSIHRNFIQISLSVLNSFSVLSKMNEIVKKKDFSMFKELKNFKINSNENLRNVLLRRFVGLDENEKIVFTEDGRLYSESKVEKPPVSPSGGVLEKIDFKFSVKESQKKSSITDTKTAKQKLEQNMVFPTRKASVDINTFFTKAYLEKNPKQIVKFDTSNINYKTDYFLLEGTSETLMYSNIGDLLPINPEYLGYIFFDETRFVKGLRKTVQGKNEKNYYYTYDTMLNNSKSSSNESLKRYLDVKNELETLARANKLKQ